jgi:hypothetical protein
MIASIMEGSNAGFYLLRERHTLCVGLRPLVLRARGRPALAAKRKSAAIEGCDCNDLLRLTGILRWPEMGGDEHSRGAPSLSA